MIYYVIPRMPVLRNVLNTLQAGEGLKAIQPLFAHLGLPQYSRDSETVGLFESPAEALAAQYRLGLHVDVLKPLQLLSVRVVDEKQVKSNVSLTSSKIDPKTDKEVSAVLSAVHSDLNNEIKAVHEAKKPLSVSMTGVPNIQIMGVHDYAPTQGLKQLFQWSVQAPAKSQPVGLKAIL